MTNEGINVHEHMLELALGALAHANWHANYHSFENSRWSELSVLQAAHACEILIKARIAQEHPLLIFEHLPKPQPGQASLSIRELVEGGRTYQYSDLPDRLWATTGIRLPGLERHKEFGRLRNTIQHFLAPSYMDISYETIAFIYEVIDPFINTSWGLFAVDYNEDHEEYIYLVGGLIRRGVRFLASPGMMECFDSIDFEWPQGDSEYRKFMESRFEVARAAYPPRAPSRRSSRSE
ncbi:hypothetical protein [Kumtagia ephedrae]|uniref:hypothetical protein n=1 Tax=Kumtagia ephedrae TaxID=2116701 RepID=UPI001A9C583C|nr:hypothetical protein [Mesorhizobium ephedrae]